MASIEDCLKTEKGISRMHEEGMLKFSGSLSGFIHVFTELVKNAEGDGSIIGKDVDEVLNRILGELASVTLDSRVEVNDGFLIPTEEANLLKLAEHISDPNFYIAEIAGVINALIELKDVCHRRSAKEK